MGGAGVKGGEWLANSDPAAQPSGMSMRRLTDQQVIERFMDELSASVRGPGHVFFTGGVSAVLRRWRAMTAVIDLSADPEPVGFFEAMPRLKELLDVNLELACPSHFIPELPGWRERSLSIGRRGSVDFSHYDFYSQALAKLERFHGRDRHDVACMIRDRLVDRARLGRLFTEIEPRLLRYPAIEPKVLALRVAHLTREPPQTI